MWILIIGTDYIVGNINIIGHIHTDIAIEFTRINIGTNTDVGIDINNKVITLILLL